MRARVLFASVTAAVTAAAVMGAAASASGASSAPLPRTVAARPWLDAALSPAQRAQLLLRQMTLPEKVDLMTGNQGDAPYAYYNAPIPRLGIPALKMADASSGIAPRGWSLVGTGQNATALPSMQALGATWSNDIVGKYANVVAAEARETGQNVLLGPDVDIMRQPWWGARMRPRAKIRRSTRTSVAAIRRSCSQRR